MTDQRPDDTTTLDPSRASVMAESRALRHDGPCGLRELCWRPPCRSRFGDYPTVERWPDTGLVFARCHGGSFDVLGMQGRSA